jgi:Ca2+-binding EF-hand superfamily protein
VDAQATAQLVAGLRRRIQATQEDMAKVFASFDDAGCGTIHTKAFTAALASVNIVLSAKEQELVDRVAAAGDGSSGMTYQAFINLIWG